MKIEDLANAYCDDISIQEAVDCLMEFMFSVAVRELGRSPNDSYQMVYEGEDGLDVAASQFVGGMIDYAKGVIQ